MGFKERAEQRRGRIVGRVSHGHEEAEESDLDFWQSLTPQERLSVATAISQEVDKIMQRRRHGDA